MNKLFSAITGNPLFVYAKWIFMLAVLCGVAYFAWDYRGSLESEGRQKAVNTAVDVAVTKIQGELETERALRTHYQTLADVKLAKLLQTISNIKVEHKTIENNIIQEVQRDPVFYSQPLPPQGYEQWKKARALSQSPSAPPASQ